MRTVRTVQVLSDIERERALLKSLLNTFGKRPHVTWQYSEEGFADVVVLSVDNPSLEVIEQAQKQGHLVVFYVNDSDSSKLGDQPFKLSKQARARHFLELIEQMEGWFGDDVVDMLRLPTTGAANDTRAVLAG
ncbi:hypothetical protein EV700_3092 [Fluviicoccus keumensis]|uniref:Uncharacterized protein n=1 Tax=Fluviicoccus keumensis TaxID=1435465 RepID=A0A4Q7YK67_9GAMM|nr:hypothetical protein [Fluviicoccus keumensis]RZU36879.1 hypothetical protein EV700_3092 [Fluviicoccus keumensis]